MQPDKNEYPNVYIHPTAIVESGSSIGIGCKFWHFNHIMPQVIIGENCQFGQNIFIASHTKIGKNVKVQNNVSIYEGLEISDDVFIGPSVVFTNIKNPRSFINRKNQYKKTLINTGVTIGANATIICGIEIGEYAFIGAGALVSKNVKPYSLVVGNPSKHIGWVSKYGHRLEFNSEGLAICPESKERYVINEAGDGIKQI